MAAASGSTSSEVIGARGWRVGRGETRKKNEILYIGGTTRPDMAAGSKTERERDSRVSRDTVTDVFLHQLPVNDQVTCSSSVCFPFSVFVGS